MSSQLGPYCVSAGLNAQILLNNGPFPQVPERQVTNGLVIELIRFMRKLRLDNTRIEKWIDSLLGYHHENSVNAIWAVHGRRDDLRRNKRSAEIATLECSQFIPNDWPSISAVTQSSGPAAAPQATSGAPPTTELATAEALAEQIKNDTKTLNSLQHEVGKREKYLKHLEDCVSDAKEDLKSLPKQKGHYSVRNVKQRDARAQKWRSDLALAQKTIKNLTHQLAEVYDEREKLRKEVKYLRKLSDKATQKVTKTKGEKLQLQKKTWKLNQATQKDDICETCILYSLQVENLQDTIRVLEADKGEVTVKLESTCDQDD